MLFAYICASAYVKVQAAEGMHTDTEVSETKQKIFHLQLSILLVIIES